MAGKGAGFWQRVRSGFRDGWVDAEKAARKREVERLLVERRRLNRKIRSLDERVRELERER